MFTQLGKFFPEFLLRQAQKIAVNCLNATHQITNPLMPLAEVEAYIQANGHLPTMPSAEIIEELGYEQQNMHKRLVQTAEELSLHTLDHHQQIQELNKRLEQLEQQQ